MRREDDGWVEPRPRAARARRGGAALAACAALLSAATGAVGQDVYRTARIADGVWVTWTVAPHSPSQFSNSLIVVGASEVTLVDTRHSRAAGRELLRTVADLTAHPVATVVLTHRHSDHHYGTQAVRTHTPEARVLAHPETARWLEREGESARRTEIDEQGENMTRWRRWLEAGHTDEGRTLEPRHVDELTAAIDRAQRTRIALEETRVVVPDVLVPDSLSWHDGRRRITVLHPGPAHTDGDLVVYLPDDGILWVGDLLEQGFPWFGDGTVTGSRRALERLAGLDAPIVLGSHARPALDRWLLDTQHRFLVALTDAVDAERAAERNVDQAVERVRLSAFQEAFAFGDPSLAERYPAFVEETVRRYWTERETDGAG